MHPQIVIALFLLLLSHLDHSFNQQHLLPRTLTMDSSLEELVRSWHLSQSRFYLLVHYRYHNKRNKGAIFFQGDVVKDIEWEEDLLSAIVVFFLPTVITASKGKLLCRCCSLYFWLYERRKRTTEVTGWVFWLRALLKIYAAA